MTIQPDATVTRSTLSGDAAEQRTIARRKAWKAPYVIEATLADETEAAPAGTLDAGTLS